MKPSRLLWILPLLFLFEFSLPAKHQALEAWPPENPDVWRPVDELVNKQQYQAALDEVKKILSKAQAAGDAPIWTKGLIRQALLEQGVHAPETAVENFRAARWPKDGLSQAILKLFYANTLWNYYSVYSYEIAQREKVVSGKEIDLKRWDQETIFSEINRTYAEVYEGRDVLGALTIKDFPGFIIPNGYPEGIRSNFRDFLTYQWVAFLANTTTWSPRASRELYLLDLKSLLTPGAKRGKIDLRDTESHPLLRIAALLDDLYAWHRARKEPDATLETQLERVRLLATSFTSQDEQDLLRGHLVKFLPPFRSHPWWAAGQVELAVLFQRANDLVRAHKIAAAGAQAFPASPGGQRCLSLQKSIEAPAFALESMALDRAGVRSIAVRHKNLSRLYFRAYERDFFADFAKNGWGVFQNYNNYTRDVVHKSKPLKSWSLDLAATPDFQTHTTYVTPKLAENAFYVIAASPHEDFRTQDTHLVAFHFITSPLVLVSRQTPQGEGEFFVKTGLAGKAISQASVEFYEIDRDSRANRLKTFTTDDQGYLKVPANAFSGRHNLFAVARQNNLFTFDPQGISLYERGSSPARSGVLVYTDRSIYRPLQKIFYKVVAYTGDRDAGQFLATDNMPVRVSFRDPNSQEIAFQNVVTNAYGSAAGEFAVPTGRLLGQYWIATSPGGGAAVRVEEYKRPTFEAELLKPTRALRLNQPAEIEGKAQYYFGLPVTSGAVKYRVFRQVQYPFWYFWRYFWFTPIARDEQVAAGEAPLSGEGKFIVNFKPEANPHLPDKKAVTYLYRVEADVTDEGGETRSASQTYRIGFVAIEAVVSSEEQFFGAKEGGKFTVLRADLAGVPKRGAGKIQIFRLKEGERTLWPSQTKKKLPEKEFHLPGDFLSPRWEGDPGFQLVLFGLPDGENVQQRTLEHDEKGVGVVKVPALPAGAYRLRYQTADEFGETFETQREFLVVDETYLLRAPIYLLTKKPSVKVGEVAELYYGSGDRGQAYVWEMSRGEKLLRREFWQTGRNPQVLKIPVTEEMRGGFTVQINLVHDHHLFTSQTTIYVPWDNKELKVAFETFRNRLRPGQEETWTVSVTGPKSEKVAAELLAYMYDRSLDYFVGHTFPSPGSLYRREGGYPGVRANLGQAHGWVLVGGTWYSIPGAPYYGPDYLQFYPNYAIGGPGRRGALGGVYLMSRMEKSVAYPASAPAERGDMAQDAVGEKESARKKGKEEDKDARANAAPAGDVPLRSNFNETAFFQPQLVTDKRGTAKIRFRVPDSVTAWKVYVHAMTADFKSMTLVKDVETAKDLMVRPYLPRFLRESDEAFLKVVIDNTTAKALSGNVTLEILDGEQPGKSLLKDFQIDGAKRAFEVQGKHSTTVTYKLKAPARMGTYAFQVIAKTKNLSDGELRPLPVLPGRVHLIQSKFAVLKHDQKRTLELRDLAQAASDPSLVHDSLVVGLDGQLLYGVLKALPYLVNYPYECLEQTLNRFLSTGIITSLYDQYPALRALADEFSKRETQLEPWNAKDANRKLALEETPWLQPARGGTKENLINVLDARIARAQKESALAKIEKAQLGNGAWPWFPGGPPSPYITLYLLQGFAKAAEFKVEIPRNVVQKAWKYMGEHYRDYYKGKFVTDDHCYAFITFLNYVLSAYPDKSYYTEAFSEDERREMLAYSFKHWKDHNPYSKALLAMTLARMQRAADAKLVIASIMDSAKTSEDQGTHWAAEDRSWLWYNDTIETHAFILRALMEVDPKNPKNDGLVLWLFLNKKMNQWKSTRATAEVVYSLVHYLKSINALGVREEATIKVANQEHRFVFEPSSYTGGQNQIVVSGDKVTPSMSRMTVDKNGKGYMFASMTWHYSTEKMPEEERGDFLAVKREYFLRQNESGRFVLRPLKDGTPLKIGDQIEVLLSIRSKHPAEYVHLRDPRAAGLEPERPVSGHHWDLGIVWYEEVRDSGANFFFENLPQGEYSFKYRLRANMAGTFKVGPATLQSMYAPEFAAFSSGATMKID